MQAGVIINPISGRIGRDSGATSRATLALEVARRGGVDVEVRVTEAAGHAVALAREFRDAGVDRVVAWGGDGTVNEVAGPLIGSGIALGIVPSGSGDGLASGLRLPRMADAALSRAFDAAPTLIDVGYLGTRHFLNIGGIGFDAAVAEAFNRGRRRGLSGYVRGALAGVWRYVPARYALELDGAPFPGDHLVVAFANGCQYGNGLTIAPHADISDGRLEAVVVAGGPAWRQLWRARRLFYRRLAPAEGVRRQSISSARISGERLRCHVDGESFEASGALEVRVEARGLRVAVGG